MDTFRPGRSLVERQCQPCEDRYDRIEERLGGSMRTLLKLIGAVVTVAAVALVAVSTALADPRISAAATANSDRSISVSWSPAAGAFGGAFIINTSPQTDATGELPDNNSTIEFDLLNTGTTSYKTLPLQGLAITR